MVIGPYHSPFVKPSPHPVPGRRLPSQALVSWVAFRIPPVSVRIPGPVISHSAQTEVCPCSKAVLGTQIRTEAVDYGRFITADLTGTGLGKERLEQMLTPQIRVDEGGTNTTNRPADNLSTTSSWGLGWGLQTTSEGLSFWHSGDNGNSKACVVVFSRQKLGLVVFSNSANGLSIMPEIVDALGGEQPELAWLQYDSYRSRARLLLKQVLAEGADSALSHYCQWRKGRAAAGVISEAQMNRHGYDLLYGLQRVEDAIEVFKRNVEDYPQSANEYDSLGEAYLTDGQKELAIKNYERSIELNPKNTNGIEALEKLRSDLKN